MIGFSAIFIIGWGGAATVLGSVLPMVRAYLGYLGGRSIERLKVLTP